MGRAGLSYPATGCGALRAAPSKRHFDATEVCVVRTVDDLHKVVAIRSAVFMVEQDCPYEEEFDGNDLSALHLLASIDGQPVATLRLRWFCGFGKVERVCIVRHARGQYIDRVLLAHAFEVAALKGYRLMLGQIQARLWPLWSRVLHCRLQADERPFSFSGYDYFEIHIPVPAHPSALTPQSDPHVLIRPEGAWDTPGILEQAGSISDRSAMAA